MRIVITGGKGMLGRSFQKELLEHEIICADLPECDITDEKSLDEIIRYSQPDAVIHCAAMTAVDLCESERGKAFLINETGSANTAKVCDKYQVRLIAISTDYVFDGNSETPYSEYDRASGGRTVYGQSKFAGEEAVRRFCADHLICRISWLYGDGGPSFVHTMLKLADGSRPELKVVADQRGNPTSTLAVVRKVRELLKRRELRGTFHLTCEGEASWAEFAAEIFRLAGIKQRITPCTTAEFPRPAPRPANSRLVKRRLEECGLTPMPDWHDALAEFMQTEK